MFVLIGAEPFTEWLPPEVERDEWGYIVTGGDGEGAAGRLVRVTDARRIRGR